MKIAIENIDVTKYLPHRGNMLMVDKLLALTDDIVETELTLSKNNIFVDNSLFQESGLIENIAQTCSIIVGSSYFHQEEGDQLDEENNSDVIGFISTIKKINIHHLPKINTTIKSKGVLVSRFDGDGYSICTMNGLIYSGEKLLLDCQLNLFIKKISNEVK